MEEKDVKVSPMFMDANVTGLSPGDMYAVWVIATGFDDRQAVSVPEYQRLGECRTSD